LKRGFPQKIGPQFPNAACQSQLNDSVELPVAPSCKKTADVLNRVRRITEAAAASVVQQSDSDWVERLLKPVLADSNCQRRVRHSAAAVGLALSMGAPTVAELFQASEAYAADAAASVQPDVMGLPTDLGASEFADVAAPEPIALGGVNLGGVELSGSTAAPAPMASAPTISAPTVIARASESAPLTETQGFTYHIVQPGETLSAIARAYGVSAADVVALNAIPQASLLTTGQTLKVPFGAAITASAPAAPAAVKVASLPGSSVDDTIARLRQQRQQLQGSLGSLKEAVAVAPEAAAPEPILDLSTIAPYRVKSGDTLDTIARQYSLTRAELVAINRFDNPNILRVDQVINLPKTAVAQPVVPPAAAQSSMASAPDVIELPGVNVASSKKGAAALMPSTAAAPSTFRVSSMPLRAPKLKANAVTQPESNASIAVAPLAPMTVQSAPKVATVVDRMSASPIPGSVYRVELGDTVAKIARSYGVSMQELLSINNISDANIIFVGQQLTVPGSSQVAGLPSAVESLVAAAPMITPTLSVAPRRSLAVQTVPSLTAIAPATAATQEQGYVDTLVSEIRQLRQRYQSQSGSPIATLPIPAPAKLAVTPAPAAIAKGVRVNPEFRAGTVARSVAPAAKPANQLVASASLGSQSYEPLVQTLLGKAVSPELPGLNSDSLLPDGAMAGFIWPAKGQFTSGYGWRWGRMHKGVDIAANEGTPIHAAAGGVVTYSAWNDGGYGNLVEITHPDGTITMYAHNSRLLVRSGERVRQGQQISEMGNTGFSTGPHLHFEIRTPGQGAVNPVSYLPKQG
jgi:murein DD-endopeptidase MepM/ murein hydrolase activator NlpD